MTEVTLTINYIVKNGSRSPILLENFDFTSNTVTNGTGRVNSRPLEWQSL